MARRRKRTERDREYDRAYIQRYREQRYAEIEQMPKIPCACGCGELIPPINKQLKPAKYKHNHHSRGKKMVFKNGPRIPWNKGLPHPRASEVHKGKKLTPEQIAQRTKTRLANHNGVYMRKGFKRSPEDIERLRRQGKAQIGEKNPFYGRHHSEKTKAVLREKISGKNSPNWRGGVATLPYGPEFTRKFKRLIRERDNYTCQRCGKTQEEVGRTLEIHHIDHNKMNNDPANLATVCHPCNVWCSYHRDEPFKKLE